MIQRLKSVAEYDALTQQTWAVIVHFGFAWNSFDRTMQRTLVELKPEFGEKIAFGFVDIDQNATTELLQRISLFNSPTLVYFRDGKQLAVEVGMKTMDDVRSRINDLFGFGE